MSAEDKLCDKIRKQFKDSQKTEEELERICEANNITKDDFLWLDGYTNFKDFKEEL